MRRRPAPSIRRVVATTMLMPVLALTVCLVALAAISARSAAERTGAAALRLAVVRAQGELRSFLAQAERLGRLVAVQIEEAPDAPADLAAAAGLADFVAAFPAASVCVVARSDGSAYGAIRDPDGLVVFTVREGLSTEHRLGPDGAVGDLPIRRYPLEPRERPWFQSAQSAPGPHWTAPYTFVRRDVPGFDLGISHVRKIVGGDGSLAAVVAVDVTFDALSTFLAEATISSAGELVVVDDRFAMLATSTGSPTAEDGSLRRLPGPIGERLLDQAGADPAGEHTADPDQPPGPGRVFTARIEGSEMLVASETLAVEPGRDWYIAAMVPARTVLREARQAQVWLIAFSALALASAVGGLLWLVARVTRPVERLQAHVQRLGAGEHPEPLDLRASRELEDLSRDLNGMATALRERAALQRSLDMAREMQQALLPAPALERQGLSLLGHIDYCDAAGGDYFDYIEIPGREGVLIAVGDVMGHGVASTILMATARAALRTEARRTESLGAMLIRVSSVLLQGKRHGRFMTMFLLHVDARNRRIRWANAGHDPGLLVVPGAREATVLGGGDLPLGIDEGVVYFEQSMDNLPAGTLLYLGTDGIREAHGPGGEEFGDARLQATMVALATRPLQGVRDGLLEAVRAFRGERASTDDVTVVLGRVS